MLRINLDVELPLFNGGESYKVWGRISQGINKPKGEQARGRTRQGRISQGRVNKGAKKQTANKPKGRNGKGAKKPDSFR